MDCSTPGLLAHHQLLEFTQTQAFQPSHPLSSPSPATFNLSQHQGLFKWVSSSHQVVKVLELQLQHQSFHWKFRIAFFLGWTGWISLQSKRLSRVFSNTTIQKHVPASSYSFHLRIFFTYYFIAKCYSFFLTRNSETFEWRIVFRDYDTDAQWVYYYLSKIWCFSWKGWEMHIFTYIYMCVCVCFICIFKSIIFWIAKYYTLWSVSKAQVNTSWTGLS